MLQQTNITDEFGIAGYSFTVHEKNKDEHLDYVAPDYFRKQDRFLLAWGDSEDVIWVYSGDIGTYYWTLEEEHWVKKAKGQSTATQSCPKMPSLFKEELN